MYQYPPAGKGCPSESPTPAPKVTSVGGGPAGPGTVSTRGGTYCWATSCTKSRPTPIVDTGIVISRRLLLDRGERRRRSRRGEARRRQGLLQGGVRRRRGG